MTSVSRDELYNTMEESISPVYRELRKTAHNLDKQMEALELRVERHLHKTRGNEVSALDFHALRDDVAELTNIVKKQGEVLKRMWAAVEELSLNVAD